MMNESSAGAVPAMPVAHPVSYPVDMSTNTSAQALQALGLRKVSKMQQEVLEICIAAQRNGTPDLSSREIQARYELKHSVRIEASTIAARVHGLVAANRLERIETPRPCSVTKIEIKPVRVPMTQARLVG